MTTDQLHTIHLSDRERDLIVGTLQTEWTRLDQARPAAFSEGGRELEQPLIDKMNLIDALTRSLFGR